VVLGAGEKVLVVVVGRSGFERTEGARRLEAIAREIGGSF